MRKVTCESVKCDPQSECVTCESVTCDSVTCDSVKCESVTCDSVTCDSVKCESVTCDSVTCDSVKCVTCDSVKCVTCDSVMGGVLLLSGCLGNRLRPHLLQVGSLAPGPHHTGQLPLETGRPVLVGLAHGDGRRTETGHPVLVGLVHGDGRRTVVVAAALVAVGNGHTFQETRFEIIWSRLTNLRSLFHLHVDVMVELCTRCVVRACALPPSHYRHGNDDDGDYDYSNGEN